MCNTLFSPFNEIYEPGTAACFNCKRSVNWYTVQCKTSPSVSARKPAKYWLFVKENYYVAKSTDSAAGRFAIKIYQRPTSKFIHKFLKKSHNDWKFVLLFRLFQDHLNQGQRILLYALLLRLKGDISVCFFCEKCSITCYCLCAACPFNCLSWNSWMGSSPGSRFLFLFTRNTR
jgi:hypothetical protein